MGGSELRSRLMEWGKGQGGEASLGLSGRLPQSLDISLAKCRRLGYGGHRATKVLGPAALLETGKHSSFVPLTSCSL